MNDLKNKNMEPTKTSVLRQLATLQSMSLDQLKEKWLDLYGTEPPQYKKQFLVKRLAHRIQGKHLAYPPSAGLCRLLGCCISSDSIRCVL